MFLTNLNLVLQAEGEMRKEGKDNLNSTVEDKVGAMALQPHRLTSVPLYLLL